MGQKYEDHFEFAKKSLKMTNPKAKKYAEEEVEKEKKSNRNINIAVAVLCVAFLIYVFDGDRQEANRKAFEERQRGNSTFCNPASGVCSDDADGKKRKKWNDALESASGD